MSNKKITLIKDVPEHDSYFKPLETALRKAGYTINTVRLDWHRKTLTQTLHQLEKEKFSPILISFSISAFFSLFLKHKAIQHIILCSPSPLWNEVFYLVPKSIRKKLGLRRVKELKNGFTENSMNKVSKTFIYGSKEISQIKNGVHRLKGKKYEVPDSSHDLSKFITTILIALEKQRQNRQTNKPD